MKWLNGGISYLGRLTKTQANGITASAIVLAIALGCTCGKEFNLSNDQKSATNSSRTSDNPFSTNDDDKGVPATDEVAALVRETMSDFTDAIRTGNFSTLYEKSS